MMVMLDKITTKFGVDSKEATGFLNCIINGYDIEFLHVLYNEIMNGKKVF